MERLNIFDALNIANGANEIDVITENYIDDAHEVFPDVREASLNSTKDDEDNIDDGGPASGDDLTDEEEPDVIGNLAGINDFCDADDAPAGDDSEVVPISDNQDSDDSDDYPFLRRQIENIQHQKRATPQTHRWNTERTEIGHLQEKIHSGKDGTQWSSVPPSAPIGRASAQNVFRMPTNQLIGCSTVAQPRDAFELFISDKMIKSLVIFTNLEGKRQKENFSETDEVEMRAFLGCILFLGAMKQSTMTSTLIFDPLYGQGFVKASFSRIRFLQLTAYLRFDDKETRTARRNRDVFAPFREFWDDFSKNVKDHYVAGPFITIDEQLVPFRGRCSFLQYLPSKPDRYGLKLFWAVDAENNFPLISEPYLGRPFGAERQLNLGRNVAIRLSTPFFKSGRNITTDNFFTDKELSDTLQNNGLTFVGTVRANKRFLPDTFKEKKGQQLHGSTFLFQEKTTLVNYQSKANKNVVVMSSMHHSDAVDSQAPKKKPDIVRFYNSTKGAVDTLDKMAHAYATKRVTKRWPMVMFYNTVDLSNIAARVVWRMKFPDDPLSKKDSRQEFIIRIAEQLSAEHMQRRLYARNLSTQLRQIVGSYTQHIIQKAEASQDRRRGARVGEKRQRTTSAARQTSSKQASHDKNKQGRCGACSWKRDRKVRSSCSSCCVWLCKEHAIIFCQDCASSLVTE